MMFLWKRLDGVGVRRHHLRPPKFVCNVGIMSPLLSTAKFDALHMVPIPPLSLYRTYSSFNKY